MTAAEEATPEPLAPEVQALALAAIAAKVKKVQDPVRAVFSHDYRNGDSHRFRSPLDGAKLGQVYRQDPDPTWVITDDAALRKHLAGLGAELTWQEPMDGAEPEIVKVLQEHAPHLLVERTAVPDETVAGVLAATKAAGQAVDPDGQPVPGITLVRPSGNLVVKPDPGAGTAAAALIRAGLLDWSAPAQLPARR